MKNKNKNKKIRKIILFITTLIISVIFAQQVVFVFNNEIITMQFLIISGLLIIMDISYFGAVIKDIQNVKKIKNENKTQNRVVEITKVESIKITQKEEKQKEKVIKNEQSEQQITVSEPVQLEQTCLDSVEVKTVEDNTKNEQVEDRIEALQDDNVKEIIDNKVTTQSSNNYSAIKFLIDKYIEVKFVSLNKLNDYIEIHEFAPIDFKSLKNDVLTSKIVDFDEQQTMITKEVYIQLVKEGFYSSANIILKYLYKMYGLSEKLIELWVRLFVYNKQYDIASRLVQIGELYYNVNNINSRKYLIYKNNILKAKIDDKYADVYIQQLGGLVTSQQYKLI